jgi:ATP-dependent RNA helicase DDX10/DBP4
MKKKLKNTFKKKSKGKPYFIWKKYGISSHICTIIVKIGYKKLTRIQKICIPPSLKGYDILCSAKTGAGKTICFAIPTVQKIFAYKWTTNDPIYSCILCPVRELAIQLYTFFNNFSSLNSIEIFLLIGGNIKEKKNNFKKSISLTIGTPGRLFQILIEKNLFNFDHLKILVLDEIDQMLDLGFKKFFFLIFKYFQKEKQILLFSATLSKQLRNIARLNLKNPFFGSVINKKSNINFIKKNFFIGIPSNIFQFYNLLSPEKKINVLFSFLKSHSYRKIIVFFSTRKQVKFFYFLFKNLKLSVNFFFCYGDLSQKKRTKNFIDFFKSKKGILFTTDILSRGLDFKDIDWVIHFDCPQNLETYLHRIGRTGRISAVGKTLLFLNYNEILFLDELKLNGIYISSIYLNFNQILSLNYKIKKLTKKHKTINILAVNAFFNYSRFLYFQKNKNIFNLNKISWGKIAEEFGLENILSQNK